MNLLWYRDNGCDLAVREAFPGMFEGIYKITGENPCEGCSSKRGCTVYPKVVQPSTPALAVSIRDRVASGSRPGIIQIQALSDSMVPTFGADKVNAERIKALNALFQMELKATADLVTQLMTAPLFLEGCRLANVEPNRRQANKCLREEGLVWLTLKQAQRDGTLPPK
jgi:hypothetical protein